MRLTRRGLLGLGAGAAASTAFPAGAETTEAGAVFPVEIQASPIDHFAPADRDRKQFGGLAFRSGLVLNSSNSDFGGFSGLWRSPSGGEIVAVSDRAHWLTAKIRTANGRLAGLGEARIAPMLARDGRPLRRTRSFDTESLAIGGGVAYVGIERTHEVLRFDWGRDGTRSRGQPIPVPAEVKRLPSNRGLEAIGVAPPRHPLAGAVIAIAEQARNGAETPTRGFVLTGRRTGAFDVVRSKDFDITDLAFLPSGEMLLLERHFSWMRGVLARMRRIAADAVAPGATVDGPVIFKADMGFEIDNMEGLAVHREPSGETILTMISDDNFSMLQRTLLLEFALIED